MSKFSKHLVVPDDKEYRPERDWVLYLILTALLVAIVFVLTSCNPVQKAYRGVAKYSPQSTEDTTNFYKRAKDLIKTPAPIVKPGRTIIQKIPVDKIIKVFDSARLNKVADSLTQAFREANGDLTTDCTRQVKEALKTGREQAIFEMKNTEWVDNDPDTIYLPDTAVLINLTNRELQLREANANVIKAIAERDIYKTRSKTKTWWIVALVVGLGLGIFLRFKTKIPAL